MMESERVLSTRMLIAAVGVSFGLVVLALARPRPLPTPGALPIPQQVAANPHVLLPAPEGYTVRGTHSYDIEAIVVGRKNYRDRSSVLSPVDFALAWGELTAPEYLPHVKFRQEGRWYHYRYGPEFPGPGHLIGSNSANTHILVGPDDVSVRSTIDEIRRGDHIRLVGYLVNVTGPDGFTWNSSKTRSDSGAGACEVLYVTHAEIIARGP